MRATGRAGHLQALLERHIRPIELYSHLSDHQNSQVWAQCCMTCAESGL